ncbi:MAG: DUF2442 domain-containing protein [Dehalococcoidia bacterium]|nr:DUF2442 domain-containing protein [Dehalococcoidia bacterium]
MNGKYELHTVTEVIPLFEYVISVGFSNGEHRYFDVSQLFNHKIMGAKFKKLKNDRALFYRVRIDIAGAGISWDEGIEIECENLYDYGVAFKTNSNSIGRPSSLKPKTTATKSKKTPAGV